MAENKDGFEVNIGGRTVGARSKSWAIATLLSALVAVGATCFGVYAFKKAEFYFGETQDRVKVGHAYRIDYYAPGLKAGVDAPTWTDKFHNIVPDAALNKILDDTYKTKSPDANFYVGLITGPGASGCASGDTMASHAGWTEAVPYSDTTRKAWSPGTVASKSVSNSGSAAVFSINASATVGGAFLVSSSDTSGGTKSGTGGTIRSCGAFSSGDKTVSNGGTLTVTITATAN